MNASNLRIKAMAYGTDKLMRGDTSEIECSRSRHRLELAFQLMEKAGCKFTPAEHKETCDKHPENMKRPDAIFRNHRTGGACSGGCNAYYNRGSWDPWVTPEIADAAYNLANLVITKHGDFEKAKIYAAKAERDSRFLQLSAVFGHKGNIHDHAAYLGLIPNEISGASPERFEEILQQAKVKANEN